LTIPLGEVSQVAFAGISAHIEIPVAIVDGPPTTEAAAKSGPTLLRRFVALAAVLAIYGLYRELRVGAGRDVFQRGLPVGPFRHALTVLKVERLTWLDFELGWHRLAMHHWLVIRASNLYYAYAHQVVTLGLVALVILKAPWRDAKRWVSGLLLQLPVALICFSLYPLMPPRLLDTGAPWGGRILQTHRRMRPTGFVDTLAKMKGPWTQPSVGVGGFTNQFAAMPSLHCAFAMWVGVVCWQWGKGKSWRALGFLHVGVTFWCVIVTANHYVLDALVGWALALGALALASRVFAPRTAQFEQGSSSRTPLMTSTSQ
jgi:PAP2 superfamily